MNLSICLSLSIIFFFKPSKTSSYSVPLMISYIQVQTVTLIPGDGIGPEISAAVMKIFDAAKVSGLF